MREELRSDIIQALEYAASQSRGRLVEELLTLARSVRDELDEGDRVECPTAEMNAPYLAEGSDPIELNVVAVNWEADQVVVANDDGTMEIVSIDQCTRQQPFWVEDYQKAVERNREG